MEAVTHCFLYLSVFPSSTRHFLTATDDAIFCFFFNSYLLCVFHFTFCHSFPYFVLLQFRFHTFFLFLKVFFILFLIVKVSSAIDDMISLSLYLSLLFLFHLLSLTSLFFFFLSLKHFSLLSSFSLLYIFH